MLPRLFIKDYQNIDDPEVRNKHGILASIVGIFWNTILSISKIVVGTLFSSVAVVADGMNNLSDAGSGLVTIIGFKIANKPADSKHPFGHARVEYITGMVISFVVLFLGLEVMISSVEKLIHAIPTDVSIVMMAVLGASILVKLLMFFYYRSVAKKLNSDVFKAMSMDSINDTLSTSAVLICTIITYFSRVELDGYVGIIVAIIIVVSGAKLFYETLSPLLGEMPPREFVEHIAKRIREHDGVLGIHDLMVHNYGPNNYHVSVHVEVDASESIVASHDLVDEIEREFKDEGIDILIHVDPIITDDERVDRMREIVRSALRDIDESITFHDFRVVWGKNTKNLIFDIVLPVDFKYSDERVLVELDNRVRAADPSAKIIVDIDRNYVKI